MKWEEFLRKYHSKDQPVPGVAGFLDWDMERVQRIECALALITGRELSIMNATPSLIDRAAKMVDEGFPK